MALPCLSLVTAVSCSTAQDDRLWFIFLASGTADVLAAITARRASYEWQYSTDGGKTWIEAAPRRAARHGAWTPSATAATLGDAAEP
jgi:hypothetical protein